MHLVIITGISVKCSMKHHSYSIKKTSINSVLFVDNSKSACCKVNDMMLEKQGGKRTVTLGKILA